MILKLTLIIFCAILSIVQCAPQSKISVVTHQQHLLSPSRKLSASNNVDKIGKDDNKFVNYYLSSLSLQPQADAKVKLDPIQIEKHEQLVVKNENDALSINDFSNSIQKSPTEVNSEIKTIKSTSFNHPVQSNIFNSVSIESKSNNNEINCSNCLLQDALNFDQIVTCCHQGFTICCEINRDQRSLDSANNSYATKTANKTLVKFNREDLKDKNENHPVQSNVFNLNSNSNSNLNSNEIKSNNKNTCETCNDHDKISLDYAYQCCTWGWENCCNIERKVDEINNSNSFYETKGSKNKTLLKFKNDDRLNDRKTNEFKELNSNAFNINLVNSPNVARERISYSNGLNNIKKINYDNNNFALNTDYRYPTNFNPNLANYQPISGYIIHRNNNRNPQNENSSFSNAFNNFISHIPFIGFNPIPVVFGVSSSSSTSNSNTPTNNQNQAQLDQQQTFPLNTVIALRPNSQNAHFVPNLQQNVKIYSNNQQSGTNSNTQNQQPTTFTTFFTRPWNIYNRIGGYFSKANYFNTNKQQPSQYSSAHLIPIDLINADYYNDNLQINSQQVQPSHISFPSQIYPENQFGSLNPVNNAIYSNSLSYNSNNDQISRRILKDKSYTS